MKTPKRFPLMALTSLLGAGLLLAAGGCDDGTTTPQNFPDFPASSAKDCAGVDVDLAATIAAHDVTYITMGAKWCTACREEVDLINKEVVANVDTSRVKVIQILLEDDPTVPPPQSLCQAWVDELKPTFDILNDVDQSVVGAFYNGTVPGSLPEHVIIRKDGKIVFQELGALRDNMADIINGWLP